MQFGLSTHFNTIFQTCSIFNYKYIYLCWNF